MQLCFKWLMTPPTSFADLRKFLAPVDDAAYTHVGGRASKCHPGTREKLIAEINRWFDKESHRRPICWLNGPAGSGKSAVSLTIAESSATKKQIAASFFFFRGAGNQSRIGNFISTLAYQLSDSVPATKPLLQAVLAHEPKILDGPLRHQFQKLVLEPILAVQKPILAILPRKPMLMIIDALDECDDKDLMAEFIEIIIEECQKDRRLPVRFFFTSRIEEHIQKKLKTSSARLATYRLALQDFDAAIDIRKFFRFRFDTIYEENSRLMQSISQPWPSEGELDELVKVAAGSFIFAVTLIKFINDGSALPHKKLSGAIVTHPGLDPLYAQVFSAAPRTDNFERVIGTLMLLNAAIPITSLANLLQLEISDVLQPLLKLQSILMIPGNNNQPVQLFHTSLRDYLTTTSRSGEFYVNPPARHLFMTIDCLKSITGYTRYKIFEKEPQKYACANWCYHFRRSLATGGGNHVTNPSTGGSLISCLRSFSQSLDSWVNTLIADDQGKIMNDLDALLLALKVNICFLNRDMV
jgi:NACHT domain